MNIRVKNNYLIYDGKKYKCAIGKGGFNGEKKEGDGCTPLGTFKITDVFYRKDKIKNLVCNFELKTISPLDGWCDDPNHKEYNNKIKFPFSHSAEKLFRHDDIYDIICVIDFNRNPVISGAGSAIFIHVARKNYSATEGCIALSKDDLENILLTISKETKIEIIH